MANRVIQARQTVIDSRYVHLAKWCVSEMHEQGIFIVVMLNLVTFFNGWP